MRTCKVCAKISGLLWLAWFTSVDVLAIVGFSLTAPSISPYYISVSKVIFMKAADFSG